MRWRWRFDSVLQILRKLLSISWPWKLISVSLLLFSGAHVRAKFRGLQSLRTITILRTQGLPKIMNFSNFSPQIDPRINVAYWQLLRLRQVQRALFYYTTNPALKRSKVTLEVLFLITKFILRFHFSPLLLPQCFTLSTCDLLKFFHNSVLRPYISTAKTLSLACTNRTIWWYVVCFWKA